MTNTNLNSEISYIAKSFDLSTMNEEYFHIQNEDVLKGRKEAFEKYTELSVKYDNQESVQVTLIFCTNAKGLRTETIMKSNIHGDENKAFEQEAKLIAELGIQLPKTPHYRIDLLTQTWDSNGVPTGTPKSFDFQHDNILSARREAIDKTKKLVQEYEGNSLYSSPMQAAALGYKNFSNYMITLVFVNGEDANYSDYIIYGDERQELIDNLGYEFNTFMKQGIDVAEIEVDDSYEVIEEAIEFLLTYNINH